MYAPLNLGTHISMRKPTKQDYSGPKDKETRLSEGIGSIIYDFDNYIQSYEGKFIWNNMHGYGEYRWESLRSEYEGQFYMNKKEGYGRFSYPSGAYFEGLYRNDRRFGPGVYTDAAGYQDVGIWVDSKLIRLSRFFEPDNVIPRLAITNEDKIRILQYRQIVNLQKDKEKHLAEDLLERLTHSRNYDKSVIARAEELYNPFCKDDRAPSFNKPKYEKTFFGNELDQFTIDVLITDEREIQQKISDEQQVVIQLESPPIDDVPRIHESKVIRDNVMHDIENIRIDQKQYIDDEFNAEKKITPLENKDKKEEDESEYCGIKPIDLEKLNDPLLIGNHENLWSIFQSSNIIIPRDSPKISKANLSNNENIEKSDSLSGKKGTSGDEFDDFGRKKIRGVKSLTKKVIVSGLLAWNNSLLLIELLKHVFKHRDFEKNSSIDVSKVLAGRRGFFRQEGAHEKAALELLEACSNGSQTEISRLILRQNVDPDVADSRGNTGLLLAAVGDRLEVIEILLNLGANVDSLNDECLTPLSLCILRLLELIHGVINWSKAFLPKKINGEQIAENKFETFENYEQWHGRVSYESLTQQMPKQMDWNPRLIKNESTELGSDNFFIKYETGIAKDTLSTGSIASLKHVFKSKAQVDERKGIKELEQNRTTQDNHGTYNQSHDQKYIFDMRPMIRASFSQRKMKNNQTKNKNNKIEVKISRDDEMKQKNKFSKNEEQIIVSEQIQINNSKTEKVRDTILKLLNRGADPNFSQVPFPVLIMAIFTKMPSLLSELLEYGADPNTTLSRTDHSLTPLLILTILQPAKENSLMAKVLLKAKANPSSRADPDCRPDLMERLSRNRASEYLDNFQGITALHLLAIRSDMDPDVDGYLEALIRVIYEDGCIKRSDLYQGHSPLSLAIVEGNLTAAKTFLKTKFINVNEQLGADLGNAMLMLESSTLQELLPPDLLQKFLELLLEYGGCPFVSADVLKEEYNQIEYGRKELTKMLTIAENSVEVKEKRSKNKSKRSSKNSKETIIEHFVISMDFVKKVAEGKLMRWIKANFVKDLMNSPMMLLPVAKQLSVFLEEPLFNYALNWMTEEDLAIVMKTMNRSRDNVTDLVRLFVTARVLTHQKNSSDVHTIVQNEMEKIIDKVMPLVKQNQQIVASADLRVEKIDGKKKTRNVEPELDLKNNKFKVCFECFGVHGKILIACPKCKRIYFCSEECNSKNTERKGNPHQCPIFYQNEWIRLEEIATTSGIDATSYMLERFQNPEKFVNLKDKIGKSKEQRDNRSSKYRDEITYNGKANNGNEEFAIYKTLEESNYKIINVNKENQPADEVEYNYEHEGSILNRTKVKERNKNIKYQENRSNINIGKKNIEDGDDKIRSKNTSTKGHELKHNDNIIKDVSGEKKLSKDFEKRRKNKVERATDRRDVKVESEKKNRHRLTNNKELVNDETEMKSKKGKKGESAIIRDKVAWIGSDGMKLKKEKKKGRVFNDNKTNEKNSKFGTEKKNLRNKTGDQRPNKLLRNNNEIMDNVKRKRGVGYNKKEWDNNTNKVTRKQDLKTWKKKADINMNRIGNNVPEKYLNCLLKINKSVGERLDIDILLLPYVVFAQGDTYFRIVPANQLPKYKGNYSLI